MDDRGSIVAHNSCEIKRLLSAEVSLIEVCFFANHNIRLKIENKNGLLCFDDTTSEVKIESLDTLAEELGGLEQLAESIAENPFAIFGYEPQLLSSIKILLKMSDKNIPILRASLQNRFGLGIYFENYKNTVLSVCGKPTEIPIVDFKDSITNDEDMTYRLAESILNAEIIVNEDMLAIIPDVSKLIAAFCNKQMMRDDKSSLNTETCLLANLPSDFSAGTEEIEKYRKNARC